MMHDEDSEQIALMQWARLQSGKIPELALLFHIPNGGKRDAREAARFKAMGVKPGVPDMFLPVPCGIYCGLWIELKRRDGGKLSKNQAEFLEALAGQGYKTAVCAGWEEAKNEILRYLG